MKHFHIVLYFLAASALAACAAAPTQEMADARAALKAAEESGAREHAGGVLGSARKSLATAETQLELGNYGDARSNAVKAQEEGASAKRIAAAINEAREAVARAAKAKGLWTVAEEALKKAQAAAQEGDEQEALAEAARAAEFAALGENQAYRERARLLLESCRGKLSGAAKRELADKASAAIANDQGKLAAEYAEKACQ